MVFDASDLHHRTNVALSTNLAVIIAHLGIGSCQNQLNQYKNTASDDVLSIQPKCI